MRRMLTALFALLIAGLTGPAAAEERAENLLPVTLYFRYADTGWLGAERSFIDLGREETVARLIVEQMIGGPQASHDRLTGLFPQGTRLVSAQGDERILYVTLNGAFLGRPDGAPSDWESRPEWIREAALRREMAFQSIVLALTEEARCQRVQLYVAEDDDEIPQRVAMTWFRPEETDLDLRLAACGRDESLLLTPKAAMTSVLAGWQAGDWDGVWPFVARAGSDAPASAGAFRREMESAGAVLLEYAVSGGNVSLDGQRASLVVDAAIRSAEGDDAEIVRETVVLTREQDNWTIAASRLKSLMVRD